MSIARPTSHMLRKHAQPTTMADGRPTSLSCPLLAYRLCSHLTGLSTEVANKIVGDGRQLVVAVGIAEAWHVAAPLGGPEIRAGQHHSNEIDTLRVVHGLAAGERRIAGLTA